MTAAFELLGTDGGARRGGIVPLGELLPRLFFLSTQADHQAAEELDQGQHEPGQILLHPVGIDADAAKHRGGRRRRIKILRDHGCGPTLGSSVMREAVSTEASNARTPR